jgi:hypothetical protein
MQKTVSVVYLIWLPYGISFFQEFVDSYKKHPAGYPHQLILLFNGVNDPKETEAYLTLAAKNNLAFQAYFYQTGQDLEVYKWIAGNLSSDYILYLNTYSKFLTDNWLYKYVHAHTEGVGVVAATGSWQSYYSSVFDTNSWWWTKHFTLKQNIGKYKLLVKAVFLWPFYFHKFPNPHIRTNSFFINRVFFENTITYNFPKKKFDAYRIESGKNSITSQIQKAGLKTLIIDKNGKTYDVQDWPASKTYWISAQENLMISDNQTNTYEAADETKKFMLRYDAWRLTAKRKP